MAKTEEQTPESFVSKIVKIQHELKAPKNQFNSFGKYNYRNAEDILEATKPLLAREGLIMTLNDEVVFIESRHYIKTTVRVADGLNRLETTAFAREEESKKGMDGSQVTGASSSYARKYALNGMFLIDDTKDSDGTNDGSGTTTAAKKTPEKKPEETKQTPAQSTAAPATGLKLIEIGTKSFAGAANWIAGTDVPTIEAIESLRTKYSMTPEVEAALAEEAGKIRLAK